MASLKKLAESLPKVECIVHAYYMRGLGSVSPHGHPRTKTLLAWIPILDPARLDPHIRVLLFYGSHSEYQLAIRDCTMVQHVSIETIYWPSAILLEDMPGAERPVQIRHLPCPRVISHVPSVKLFD